MQRRGNLHQNYQFLKTKASKQNIYSLLIVASPSKESPPKESRHHLSIPTPKSTSKKENVKALLIRIKEYNRTTTPENQSILAAKSLPHTSKHEGLINSVLEDYVQCLSSYKNNKLDHLLDYVPFDGPGTYDSVPRIFVVLGGKKDNNKLQLVIFC